MNPETRAILDKVFDEEYGPRARIDHTLQFRLRSDDPKAKGSYIEVFTVGKWRAVTSCRASQVKDGLMSPRLRQYVLLSLGRNGGLLPGVRAEDHGFLEVK